MINQIKKHSIDTRFTKAKIETRFCIHITNLVFHSLKKVTSSLIFSVCFQLTFKTCTLTILMMTNIELQTFALNIANKLTFKTWTQTLFSLLVSYRIIIDFIWHWSSVRWWWWPTLNLRHLAQESNVLTIKPPPTYAPGFNATLFKTSLKFKT